ncbi:MAG: hypothetical protein R2726_23540 [Acidimicrobiales bacterium]
MTDLPIGATAIPNRLGTTMSWDGDDLVTHLTPMPSTMVAGALRASAGVFLVDVAAGIQVDTDPEAWTFTSDLSLRLPAAPAPRRVDARTTVLRGGRRSVTADVALTDETGAPWGWSTLGFTRVPRRPDDPAKPEVRADELAAVWARIPLLEEPLREAADVRVLDPSRGEAEVDVRPDLTNPAGALQGAMVALLIEIAAEELASHHAGAPRIVTELDLRFLGQGRVGPVRSRAWSIGRPEDEVLRVELRDGGADGKLLTTALVRTRPLP